MKKVHLAFILFIAINSFSQYNTANVWYTGNHAGVSFNTGIPVALTDGQMETNEGCATLCDTDGNLLFYTDGISIWNKNHQVMPNGNDLMGNPSASQSAIITPYPQNDSLYLVFTVDARENDLQNGLRYSIINMALDSGLGDVTSEKNILLHAPVSERITSVIKNNQTDYWIIVHEWGTNRYLSYSITSSGVDTVPVVSDIGCENLGGNFTQQHSIGYMKANIDGDKIAVANFRNYGFFELFDFDKSTGILSNVITSNDDFYRPYGVEFSPSGDVLYGSIMGGEYHNGKIYQFDLTQDNPLSNPTLIGSSSHHLCALQLGPNGKIYTAIKYYEYLGVINEPEKLGATCNFIHDAVYLEGNTSGLGLPSLFYKKGVRFFTGSEQNVEICEGDSIFLQNAWQTVAGTYYDTLLTDLYWDSIVNTHLTILPVPPEPSISESENILISSSPVENQWYYNGNAISGASSQTYQPFVNGNYQVSVRNSNGCLSFSEVYSYVVSSLNSLTPDIKVYPNPFKDDFFIEYNNKYNIKIYDLRGILLQEETNLSGKSLIKTKNLSKGVYILEITSKNQQEIRQLINVSSF